MPLLAGKQVGPTGLGLMNLTWRPMTTPDSISFAILKTALSHDSNFWNAGEFYGMHPTPTTNLELLNRYFTAYPEDSARVLLSVKGGAELLTGHLKPQGDRDSIRRSVENVLRILDGKVKIGIFECGRVDTSVPLEETILALAEYVEKGLIGGIGLSEVGPNTIRKAHSIYPISAVEVEVSLWSTEIFEQGGVADTCAELGIPIVAYAPLGRGFLTGQIKSPEDIPAGDLRHYYERFQPQNFDKNIQLVTKISKIAERKKCTNAQLALAWVRQMGNRPGKAVIIPIPGATSVDRAEENCKQGIVLAEEDLKEIEEVLGSIEVAGRRYNKAHEALLTVDHA